MQRISFHKISITVISLLILNACASSQDRFPDYSETVKNRPSLAVVIDLFVYQDILGKSRGYNKQINQDSLDDAIEQVNEVLTERGFSVEFITGLNGLTYEMSDDVAYMISENWKSTDEPYKRLPLDQGDSPWYTSETKEFLSNSVKVAKEISFVKDRDQAYAQQKVIEDADSLGERRPVGISEITLDPSLFEGLESEVVLFLQVHGRFQKLGKFLTKGLLVGAASSALTGGLVMIPKGSYAVTSIVAFDVNTKNILWHNEYLSEGKNGVKNSVKNALKTHPFIDGKTILDKKREKERERQKVKRLNPRKAIDK